MVPILLTVSILTTFIPVQIPTQVLFVQPAQEYSFVVCGSSFALINVIKGDKTKASPNPLGFNKGRNWDTSSKRLWVRTGRMSINSVLLRDECRDVTPHYPLYSENRPPWSDSKIGHSGRLISDCECIYAGIYAGKPFDQFILRVRKFQFSAVMNGLSLNSDFNICWPNYQCSLDL